MSDEDMIVLFVVGIGLIGVVAYSVFYPSILATALAAYLGISMILSIRRGKC